MPWASGRQFHVPFDKEDTGIADLAAPLLDQAEALLEQGLVPLAVRETGAETKNKNYSRLLRCSTARGSSTGLFLVGLSKVKAC